MNFTVARQMLAAEVLKLRRNRGLMALAAVVSLGVVVLFFGYTAIRHASNPSAYGPAGGIVDFGRAVRLLGLFFGSLTAILIGAEAGAADISSGVFRDLVATGRSRLALFGVRVPAAIAVTLAFTLPAYALTVAASFAFAGGNPDPSVTLILQSLAWVVLADAVIAALAVGVGSLTGSRPITLTAIIGWQAIATSLLISATSLGSVRDALLTPALGQLMPVPGEALRYATGTAVVVITCWVLAPAALGAWRSRTQDA